MKVLSLWQPYAQLVVIGAKLLETRDWPLGNTPCRLAIHASKKTTALRKLFATPHFFEALAAAGFTYSEALPLGALIGTVEVTGCRPVENVYLHDLTDKERAFGDYTPGRFAWYLKNPVGFPPIPMVGHQGLRELPADILAQIPERAL